MNSITYNPLLHYRPLKKAAPNVIRTVKRIHKTTSEGVGNIMEPLIMFLGEVTKNSRTTGTPLSTDIFSYPLDFEIKVPDCIRCISYRATSRIIVYVCEVDR